MTTPQPGWKALPECLGCSRPTRRATFQRLGGYCSTCHTQTPAQGDERLQLHEWQTTVHRVRSEERARAAARADRLRARRNARGAGRG